MPVLPILVATAIAGTVTSAVGQISAGNSAKAIGDANANAITEASNLNYQSAQQTASDQLEQAQVAETQQRQKDRLILSRTRALIGSSGLALQGSPLDVLAENTKQAEIDALQIRRTGQLTADATTRQAEIDRVNAGNQAAIARAGGQAQSTASYLNAGSTILGGGINAYKTYKELL